MLEKLKFTQYCANYIRGGGLFLVSDRKREEEERGVANRP